MSRPSRLIVCVLITAVMLAACSSPGATVEPAAEAEATGTPPDEEPSLTQQPTQTEPPPQPTPTPTEAPREFRTSQGPSGVFSLSIPAGWEQFDESSERRLRVRYLPPAGYGSRVTVEVTNEGPLTPEQVAELAASTVHQTYDGSTEYELIDQTADEDGTLRYTFAYDDGQGGAGQETLLVRQSGPYFAALRVFLAAEDEDTLTQALDTVEQSFRVDAAAQWSTGSAAVNPAALLVENTALWDSDNDVWGTVFSGEVINASETAITDVTVRLVLCDSRGVVMGEYNGGAGLSVVEPGGVTPFALHLGDVIDGLEVCSQSAEAAPAPASTAYTVDLQVQADAGQTNSGDVVVQGQVSNPGLAPVGDVRVLMSVYAESGQLVGFETAALGADVVLGPGETAPFTHTFTALGDDPARVETQAQGRTLDGRNPSLSDGPDEG